MIMILTLKYKGSRNYLHGTDIFNSLQDALSKKEVGHLAKLVFNRFARNQIEVLMEEQATDNHKLGYAVWKPVSGKEKHLWLYETGVLVNGSYPYEEDAILSNSMIQDRVIKLSASNPYSTIENIIALTKKLNYAISPDVQGQWLFGQIDLQLKLPEEWKLIQINQTVGLANKFSRNRILIDGLLYGEIRFIVGQP